MTSTKLILVLAALAAGARVGQEPKVTQVLSKDLTDISGCARWKGNDSDTWSDLLLKP